VAVEASAAISRTVTTMCHSRRHHGSSSAVDRGDVPARFCLMLARLSRSSGALPPTAHQFALFGQ
jgi:hypothetical protein